MKRLFAGLLTLCLLGSLAACGTLAKEESAEAQGDTLIGLFVTNSAVDPAPQEADTLAGDYIYGTQDPKTGEITFSGVTGYAIADAPLNGDSGDLVVNYWVDPHLMEVRGNLSATDAGEQRDTSAVLYCNAADGSQHFSLCFIYRTPEGKIYLDRRSPGLLSTSEGDSTLTVSQDDSVTKNGETSGKSVRFAVTFRPVTPCGSVRFTQYDAAKQALTAQEYAAGALPASLVWEEGAAYLIAEELYPAENGGAATTYALLERSETTYQLPVFSADGSVAVGRSVDLLNAAETEG